MFLMGRELVNLLQNGKITYASFMEETQFHIVLALYISLLFLQIGFILCERLIKKVEPKETVNFFNSPIKREIVTNTLRKYAKIIFIVGWILNIFVSLEQIIYVANNSYLEFAKSFTSQIPYIVRIVANFRTIALFIFLATLPSKKDTKPILIMYFLEAISSLLFGDRGNCVISILIMIFYIVFRQYINKEEKWITKKQVIVIIIMIPFIFAFLSAFVKFREGIDVGDFTISNQITRFFKVIGKSVDIIGYEKKYETQLQDIGSLYTFGDIKQYVLYNPITEIIFNVAHAPYHTEEYALSGQSFMHTISYLIDSEAYLQGHGYGSSYIAELCVDFGYIGIALGNLFLGAYIAIFYKIYKKSYILTGCLLLSYRMLFLIPRAPYDYIITYVLNLTAIVSILIISSLTIGEIILKNRRERIE